MRRAEQLAALMAERYGLHGPPLRYGLSEPIWQHDDVFDDCDIARQRRRDVLDSHKRDAK